MALGILIQDNGELAIEPKRNSLGYITEGILIGDTLLQDQTLLLKSYPGEWKENPLIGVGMRDFMNDDADVEELHYRIERQFKMCGFVINSLSGKTTATTAITATRNE